MGVRAINGLAMGRTSTAAQYRLGGIEGTSETPWSRPRRPHEPRRSLLLVAAYPGQPSAGELERRAAAGERPRKDYVEVARALDADVLDFDYMQRRATPIAR